MKKLITTVFILSSIVFAQSNLLGLWYIPSSAWGGYYQCVYIYKTSEGYFLEKAAPAQLPTKWKQTGRIYAIVDPWFGESYYIDHKGNQVIVKRFDDEFLLVKNRKYKFHKKRLE